jgi:hypothetical protein
MTLDPQLAFTALRIIGDFGRARAAIGTGFCITVPSRSRPGTEFAYVLTAHHVVDGENRVEIQAPDQENPGVSSEPVRVDGWEQPIPKLDLAIAPLPPQRNFMITALAMGWHVVPDLNMAPHLGGLFHYVGLLAPLERPMVRSGTIGAVDQDGVEHDSPGYVYSCHLADCRSYGGFSGSPCFLEIPHSGLQPQELPVWLPQPSEPVGRITYTHVLCGMFTEHLDAEDPIRVVSRLGVGIILRSKEICDAVSICAARDDLRLTGLRPSPTRCTGWPAAATG